MTTEIATATENPPSNPLDSVEELVLANQWNFDRADDNQMIVEMEGRWCSYRLYFMWQEEHSSLQFACLSDTKVPEDRAANVRAVIQTVNERLWMGHFDLCSVEQAPLFRYTLLLRGTPAASMEQLEDLLEAALVESERYVPVFHMAAEQDIPLDDVISIATMDTVGEA